MKKFKGVIGNWRQANGRVEGVALWHSDGTTLERAMLSPNPGAIANGHAICTSPLILIVPTGGDFMIAETRNSYYALVGPEQ